jgi:hypothetical protein
MEWHVPTAPTVSCELACNVQLALWYIYIYGQTDSHTHGSRVRQQESSTCFDNIYTYKRQARSTEKRMAHLELATRPRRLPQTTEQMA